MTWKNRTLVVSCAILLPASSPSSSTVGHWPPCAMHEVHSQAAPFTPFEKLKLKDSLRVKLEADEAGEWVRGESLSKNETRRKCTVAEQMSAEDSKDLADNTRS
mmetsp:Transcript_16809/g.39948  ORF Transcript_16809/g.39948 Transcript_16809/m.39948 type:complete len:104 (-) Transcript_16809:1148-1459(-)